MYSQTISPSRVTWNIRPCIPSQIRVLPLGSRRALEMKVLEKVQNVWSEHDPSYCQTISFVIGSISRTREPWKTSR